MDFQSDEMVKMNTQLLSRYALIDLDAFVSNFEAVRRHVPKETKLMAVIKADAYGHGAVKAAKVLEDKADFFGVAMIDEAVELCRAEIKTPILVLGYTPTGLYPVLVKHKIRPSIFSLEDARELDRCAKEMGVCTPIHLALDTGMSRIGFEDTDSSLDVIEEISKFGNVRIEGIFSHFAKADSADKAYAEFQRDRFASFTEKLSARGINIPIRHLYNSAATLELDANFDMMREGIILYGLRPSFEVDMEGAGKFTSVMSLRARVEQVKMLEAGVAVSYDCTYVTERPTRVATVCAGYADGIPRVLSNKASVLVRGQKAPIIGRICMDQFMIDVTDVEGVQVGDTVTVFGRDGDNEICADELARLAGTIGYELVCAVTKRVPRVYLRNGEIEDITYGIPHEE